MKIIDSAATDVVPLLSEQEEVIASLYNAFSIAVPEMNKFWRNLVAQEKAHAEVLGMLVRSYETDDIYLDTGKFKAEAIRTNIDSIRKRVIKTDLEGVTPIGALALASDIEHSLIESEYFSVISFRVPSARRELEALERHTEQHVSLVEEHLNKMRNMEKVMVG